ncbi:MAG: DNA adenine methylase, partial [Duncaniella sp.]|nr:DNA adenine methylase [Duncaniella sp.]
MIRTLINKETNTKARPFLKWAGGKTQLLPVIDTFLPDGFREEREVTYIEPFVGGGAMLFYMLQKYPNIRRAVINDINWRLVKTYSVIKDNPKALIDSLDEIQDKYRSMASEEARKDFFLSIRLRFNTENITDIEEASYMIFLNRTCFNGLYRENSKGYFNVPFGRYSNPTICDKDLILADSELLQKVEILHGDFSQTSDYVEGYTFFYFDPPYRPLDATSSFNSYVKEVFDDAEQKRLKDFYTEISEHGCLGMLSNSDCRGRNEEDTFLDDLYRNYFIERVYAKRCINAKPSKRGSLTELLIRNYSKCQGST